jgi:hypothetical protein
MNHDITDDKAATVCFVCEKKEQEGKFTLNQKVLLHVCMECKDSPEEKLKEEELLDSLSDGLFCGCI